LAIAIKTMNGASQAKPNQGLAARTKHSIL